MKLEDPILVFISSKQAEFRAERTLIQRLIESTPHMAPVLAEDWSPERGGVRDRYVGDVERCDIYVGLFGCVYSAPTEEEYRVAARNPARELLIYMRDCEGNRDPQLATLIAEIEATGVPAKLSAKRIRDVFLRDLNNAVTRMLRAFRNQSERPRLQSRAGDSVILRDWDQARASLSELGYPVDDRAAMRAIENKFKTVARELARQQSSVLARLFGG